MFGFGKKKPVAAQETQQVQLDENPAKKTLFSRLKQGLQRTRSHLTESLTQLALGKKAIDEEVLDELETRLLTADVGIDATQTIIQALSRQKLKDSDALFAALQRDMVTILQPVAQPLVIPVQNKPFVILMIGINGAGKTTTIGKLTQRLQRQGKSVMLAAGDTFRAAAVEQLKVWGQRHNVPVIAQHTGADSASVIYDALSAATAKKMDVLIADTAGRLHTQDNLMAELQKVARVMKKIDPEAPHEVMLVIDASIGQNALNQAEQFHQAIGVTGITVTKLDGTAKGGILFAMAKKTGLPIRFIGIGETAKDLRPFVADDFVAALLNL
jgi:fused signal recognition particle receptor